jgi:hypothetical protein
MSLASAVPAALLKKLQSRGGSDRRLTTSLKENKENDDDTSTAPTPEKPTRMPSDRLSPCAREAQRLEEKRRLRRLEQDTARERAALTDETSEFKEMITLFREKNATDAVAAGAAASAERLRVCVRKRPLLPSELQANEFDVITAFGRRAVLHQTRRRVNLERCLENHSFTFDAVFDEAAGTEAVYAATARPLMERYFGAIARGPVNTPAEADVPTLAAPIVSDQSDTRLSGGSNCVLTGPGQGRPAASAWLVDSRSSNVASLVAVGVLRRAARSWSETEGKVEGPRACRLK